MRQQPFASPGEALDSLSHHGVKGMKWGVRKEEDSAGSQGKVGVVDPVSAAIGAAYIAAFLAGAYVTIRDLRRAAKDSGEHIQKANADVTWKKKPDLAKTAPPMTVDTLHANVVKQINPKFGKSGTKMNCRRCTFAYEMRRRGYDVTATKSHFATGQDLEGLRQAMHNTKDRRVYKSVWGEKQIATPSILQTTSTSEKSKLIFDHLGKEPNGSRGELAVAWSMGGGHSMAYEVVNHKPIIFDTQSGETYRDSKSFEKFAKIVHDGATTRTDNAPLDEHYLKRWMVNNDGSRTGQTGSS